MGAPVQRRPDQRSQQAQEYRRLYKTARWQSIRLDQLAKRPLCETCESAGRITPAKVCNHADKDSKATVEGFFAGPFTSACTTCHDSALQKQERRGSIIGCDEGGVPLDPRHAWSGF